MLDFADAVAINKFERRGAEDALRDVRRQMARNREDFATPPDELPVFGTIAARFNDDGVTALYQHLRGLLAESGPAGRRRPPARRSRPACRARRRSSCRPPGCATWPRSPRPCAATTRTTVEQAAAARRRQQVDRGARGGRGRPPRLARADRRAGLARRGSRRRAHRRHPPPARRVADGGRGQHRAGALPRVAVGHARAAGRAPAVHRPRRAAALAALGEPARLVPVHRRRVPAQARGRGPGPHVRRRGRPGPHQPPLPPARRGAAGHPPVDRVRLGHALRLRPRRAARHLRQGRQLGRVASPRSTT